MTRPRFTFRTGILLGTLICAYFGAWEATRRGMNNSLRDIYGEEYETMLEQYRRDGVSIRTPMPFIVQEKYGDASLYYVWFFGKIVPLGE